MRSKRFNNYIVCEDGTIYNNRGKKLKIRENNGRYEIQLNINNERKYFLVHRLIYLLFIEEFDIYNKNICIVAKDGNYLNISLSNLILMDRKDIIQGDNHNITKLSDLEIKEIRESYSGKVGVNQHNKVGLSYNDLAVKYNTTKANIKLIVKGLSRNKDNYILK